jgi:hypothetical protein
MTTSDEIRNRIEAFARELCEDLDGIDDSNALSWLDAIEDRAVQIGDAVTTAILEKNATDGLAPEDESICPQCDQPGRYQGMRQRELLARRGPATIAEPEYYCPCCRKAFFPGDQSDRR